MEMVIDNKAVASLCSLKDDSGTGVPHFDWRKHSTSRYVVREVIWFLGSATLRGVYGKA